MGNVDLFLDGVPFKSPFYHVLLYGINEVSPKIGEIMDYDQNSITLPPLIADLDDNLPKVLIRRSDGLRQDAMDKMLSGSLHISTSTLSHLTRFIDGNTMQPHFELFVLNDKDHDPKTILLSIICAVHMLRIRGFKFLTPLISSVSYVDLFENPGTVGAVQLEDVGLGNLDTNNSAMELEDLQWVYDNIPWFFSEVIGGGGEFSLPIEMLYSSIFSSSEKSKLASLWIGIESLIKTNDSDISKTVKGSLVAFGGVDKRKAWDLWGGSLGRCRVIHGVVSDSHDSGALAERVGEVRGVLCKMLQYFIENKIIPTRENVSSLL